MSDLSKAFSKSNLERAWRWINSNPSFQYKNYFRDSYSSYNISLDSNIKELSNRLRKNVYKPSKPSLLLLPKNTISTRPYTLLTVEDQIVYQALVNYLAEAFYNKVKKNYYEFTFGNLYAGKRSPFFYRKWEKGYQSFNKKVREAYEDGYKYMATFDLTACYDTIDHHVLSSILENNGVEKEFTGFLCNILKVWSSNIGIYKGHGIPQGPLSSGLIAEIVLAYFDEKYKRTKGKNQIKYLRYVDDIKLLANNEKTLKKMIVKLDFYCKQIGLFPQSSKIEIREITEISNEIFDFSSIELEILQSKIKNRENLLTQFKSTYNGTHIVDKTKFKMYLSAITPNATISNKLIDILYCNPQYFQNICLYFNKYPRNISEKVLENILISFKENEIFQVVTAALIDEIAYNISEVSRQKMLFFCKKKWSEKEQLNPQLRFSIAKFLIINQELKFTELKKYIDEENDWWVKKSILKYVDYEQYGESSYWTILCEYLETDNIEMNVAAINEILEKDLKLKIDVSSINYKAQEMLKSIGLINRSSTRPSAIHECMKSIINSNIEKINWKRVFDIDHHFAENKMIRAKSYSSTDISAFVNIMDTFNDMLLDKLFEKVRIIGSYQLGNIGGVVFNTGTLLEKDYPSTFNFCKFIHELRSGCDLSHPIVKKTKKYTNPIPYKTIYKIRPQLKSMIVELTKVW